MAGYQNLERIDGDLPKGNQWMYGERNIALSPRRYPSMVEHPTGVLANYVEFLQEKIVRDGWNFQTLLLSDRDQLFSLPRLAAVFTHPKRDLLIPDCASSDSQKQMTHIDDLRKFVQPAVIDDQGSVLTDLRGPFMRTNYEPYLGKAGFNTLGFSRWAKKGLLRKEQHVQDEFWAQLGVGFVLLEIEPVESIIAQQSQRIQEANRNREGSLGSIDLRRKRLIAELVALQNERSQLISVSDQKIAIEEAKLRSAIERKLSDPRPLFENESK